MVGARARVSFRVRLMLGLGLGLGIPLRKEWLSTLVFLPGESHGKRSLVGYSPVGCKETQMTHFLIHIVGY